VDKILPSRKRTTFSVVLHHT